jgi:hypothetical protein
MPFGALQVGIAMQPMPQTQGAQRMDIACAKWRRRRPVILCAGQPFIDCFLMYEILVW